MTTHDRQEQRMVREMIEAARPDQVARLLEDIHLMQTPICPTHASPERLQ